MFQRCVALKIFVANRLCNIALAWNVLVTAQSIPRVPIIPPPPPGHMSGICHLVGPSGRGLSENLRPRVGHLWITYLDSFIKNIFNVVCVAFSMCSKRQGSYFVHNYGIVTFPHNSLAPRSMPQYFSHPSKKLLPANVISSYMEEKQSMYRLKSLKEKTLSLLVNCRGTKA